MKTIIRLCLSVSFIYAASASRVVYCQDDKAAIQKEFHDLLASGKCSTEESIGGRGPFSFQSIVNEHEEYACFAEFVCEGLKNTVRALRHPVGKHECESLSAWGDDPYARDGYDLETIKEKEPRKWEKISQTTRCSYDGFVHEVSVPSADPFDPEHPKQDKYFSAVVYCKVNGVPQPASAVACPRPLEKKIVDGKEVTAYATEAPSVSECFRLQNEAGFKVVKAKLRDAALGPEFLVGGPKTADAGAPS